MSARPPAASACPRGQCLVDQSLMGGRLPGRVTARDQHREGMPTLSPARGNTYRRVRNTSGSHHPCPVPLRKKQSHPRTLACVRALIHAVAAAREPNSARVLTARPPPGQVTS